MHNTIVKMTAAAIAAGILAASPANAATPSPSPTSTPTATPSTTPSATPSATPTETEDASTLATHRKSSKCKKPKGKKLNISWGDSALSSTTFYFNNHCKETKRIKVWYQSDGKKCKAITVKGGVKGRKKISRVHYYNLISVGFGKCPY